MNSSSCSAAKVTCCFISLASYLCFFVISPFFYFLGNKSTAYSISRCKRKRSGASSMGLLGSLGLGLARTVYMHRIQPYVWWISCQNDCIFGDFSAKMTVYLVISLPKWLYIHQIYVKMTLYTPNIYIYIYIYIYIRLWPAQPGTQHVRHLSIIVTLRSKHNTDIVHQLLSSVSCVPDTTLTSSISCCHLYLAFQTQHLHHPSIVVILRPNSLLTQILEA